LWRGVIHIQIAISIGVFIVFAGSIFILDLVFLLVFNIVVVTRGNFDNLLSVPTRSWPGHDGVLLEDIDRAPARAATGGFPQFTSGHLYSQAKTSARFSR
jgi:hypothetical protein